MDKGRIDQREFGYYTIKEFYYQRDSKLWKRIDEYHIDADKLDKHSFMLESNGHKERVFVTGSEDISYIQAGYDQECSCCFLGFAHSEDYHRQSVSSKLEACALVMGL